ncbi:ribosomal protein L4 domain-containing protein [Kalaharituber pfeilii]|nr:ribosomal protein L4 domain-containing protein [Kalaharituber pfeilii]
MAASFRKLATSASGCMRMTERRPGLEGMSKLCISPLPVLPRPSRIAFASSATALGTGLVRPIPQEPPAPKPKFLKRPTTVYATVYKFPTLEPLQMESYPATFLQVSLRRDILYRAIVYEGDKSRLGRARTKTRSEIHGSGRKLRPQKGTGRARLGDRSSPMLRGGAKAHGPKVRDFSTRLAKRVYDWAFRMALSYRYRRGTLIVVDDLSGHEFPDPYYVQDVLKQNGWGRGNKNSMFISYHKNQGLEDAFTTMETEGRALSIKEVDCKNLLEMGRVIIEKKALDYLLKVHCPQTCSCCRRRSHCAIEREYTQAEACAFFSPSL